jgi:hypothetical protein
LFINPVPVKTQEVHDNLPAHSVIQSLLQIQPTFPKEKILSVHEHNPWHDLPTPGIQTQIHTSISNGEQLRS